MLDGLDGVDGSEDIRNAFLQIKFARTNMNLVFVCQHDGSYSVKFEKEMLISILIWTRGIYFFLYLSLDSSEALCKSICIMPGGHFLESINTLPTPEQVINSLLCFESSPAPSKKPKYEDCYHLVCFPCHCSCGSRGQ